MYLHTNGQGTCNTTCPPIATFARPTLPRTLFVHSTMASRLTSAALWTTAWGAVRQAKLLPPIDTTTPSGAGWAGRPKQLRSNGARSVRASTSAGPWGQVDGPRTGCLGGLGRRPHTWRDWRQDRRQARPALTRFFFFAEAMVPGAPSVFASSVLSLARPHPFPLPTRLPPVQPTSVSAVAPPAPSIFTSDPSGQLSYCIMMLQENLCRYYLYHRLVILSRYIEQDGIDL